MKICIFVSIILRLMFSVRLKVSLLGLFIALATVCQLTSCGVDPSPSSTTNYFRGSVNAVSVTSFYFNSSYASSATQNNVVLTLSGVQITTSTGIISNTVLGVVSTSLGVISTTSNALYTKTVSGNSVYGLDAFTRSITVNFSEVTTIGSQNLKDISKSFNPSVYLTIGSDIYFPKYGYLSFSRIDYVSRRVEGNFSFVGFNANSTIKTMATVTGGSFASGF